MTNLRLRVLTLGILALVAGACASASASTSPSARASPSPSAPSAIPLPITTPEAAWAAVVAHEPRFAGVLPRDRTLIGSSAWYEIRPASGVGAFVVSVTVGWGDCEAGCIDHHTWVHAVTPDGGVSTVSEQGPPSPGGILPVGGGSGHTGISGVATAGPVCPVERVPPDPACAPRAVANATVTVLDGSGAIVASTTTGVDGSFVLDVPAGEYSVVGGSVEGVMRAPAPVAVKVSAGRVTAVDLGYDTSIR